MDVSNRFRAFSRRNLAMCLALVVLFAHGARSQQQQLSARPSIEGRVVRMSDKAPIAGATVELIGIEDGRVRSRTQTTKQDGVFRFSDLIAGTAYQIVVTGSGIQPSAHGQNGPRDAWDPITLSSGQQLTGVEITPQLLTAIRGKVLDGRGRELVGNVSVMRMAYVGGRMALEQVAITTANLRGEYRFSALPLGVYYLRAAPRNRSLIAEEYLSNPAGLDARAASGQSVGLDEPRGHPVSYYPGGSLERATAIHLGDGTILEDMDFRIEEVRTVRLKGTITGVQGKPIPGRVLLVPERGALDSNWTRSFESRNGEFDIRGVLPGSYVLLANGVEESKDVSTRTTVTIADGEEEKSLNVSLSQRPGVRGRITIEDWAGPGKPDLQRLVIVLAPAEMPAVDSTLLGGPHDLPSGRVAADADGNFTINNLQPWDYRVLVASIQQTTAGELVIAPLRGAYVKSVRLDGREVVSEGFSVEKASLENLEITLATTAASLDGKVAAANGEESAFARVVLVPADRSRKDLYHAATASSTGAFQFQFLAPGTYKAFAWQGVPDGAWLDPEFLKAYEADSAEVEILPDTANQVDLTVSSGF